MHINIGEHHLPLSGNRPKDNVTGGVLVILLASVLTTQYIPLLLTDKTCYPIQLYYAIIYMKHYTYDILLYNILYTQ